jgi:ribosomal protein S15P/S13E
METLNKYLEQLPRIKNSSQAVASTEYGNVSFNESTLASIILNHIPVSWRNQYNVTHPIVPESPRAILSDLENLEKVFVEKSNEAARANKVKVTAAAKLAGEHVPRKGKRAHGGRPKKGTPKKGRTNKFYKWCKAVCGPFTTHNTIECRRFNMDGSQKDRPTKPFDSTKNTPWKKPSGGDPTQMAYLTEEITKLKKKLKKSKKHSKKRARDSSDSDSDSS